MPTVPRHVARTSLARSFDRRLLMVAFLIIMAAGHFDQTCRGWDDDDDGMINDYGSFPENTA